MYPLFETICINKGVLLNFNYHVSRFERSYRTYYGKPPLFQLTTPRIFSNDYKTEMLKLKASYNETEIEYVIEPYVSKPALSLQLVRNNTIDYSLKYADRTSIAKLLLKKQQCDDVLIIRNGLVTDTSICNIVFFDGTQWVTPKDPLLKGTSRQRLLDQAIVTERAVSEEEILTFKSFKLINAMRDFDIQPELSIDKILF